MKKLTIISAVVIFIVLIITFFVYELNFDPNRELVFNDLKAMFKPSVPYNIGVDIDDIKNAWCSSPSAGREYNRGDDDSKLKKFICFFNTADIIEVPYSELPNISPGYFSEFYDDNENVIFHIEVFDGGYFVDYLRNKCYRYRKQTLYEDIGRIIGIGTPW